MLWKSISSKAGPLKKFLADEHKVTDEEVAPPKPKEIRIVLRNSLGKIDPLNIEDYIAEDGYAAAAKALSEMTPEDVIETVLNPVCAVVVVRVSPPEENGSLPGIHPERSNI